MGETQFDHAIKVQLGPAEWQRAADLWPLSGRGEVTDGVPPTKEAPMVIETARTAPRQTSQRGELLAAAPDRVTQIIAIARVWDIDADLRPNDGLPPPRAGWAPTFAIAAERGFVPRSAGIGDD